MAYGIKDNAFGYLLLMFRPMSWSAGLSGRFCSCNRHDLGRVSDPLLGHWSGKHVPNWVADTLHVCRLIDLTCVFTF